MKNDPTVYTLRPVQLQGWNLQIGVCASDGTLLYVGKSETLSFTHCHDISIYNSTGALLVSGEQRKGKPSYLFRFVLMRDGNDVCSIQQKHLISREQEFTFSDGMSCGFHGVRCALWRPVGATYSGSSETGWRYEVTPQGDDWNVSIWGLKDNLPLLSALIYCYRNCYYEGYA